jgi:uncharacterized membrane protein
MNSTELSKIATIAIIFPLVDYFYLTATTNHYSKLIQDIQNSPLKLDLLPTVLCYIVLVLGLYYFIIKDNRNYIDAFILGLVIYAIFELTNKAIFKNWTWYTVFLDSIWGGIVFSLTTHIVYNIYEIK